jgi:transposase-like protein
MRIKIEQPQDLQNDAPLTLESVERVAYSVRYKFEYSRPNCPDCPSTWMELAKKAALELAHEKAALDLQLKRIVSKVKLGYGQNVGGRRTVMIIVESNEEIQNGQNSGVC